MLHKDKGRTVLDEIRVVIGLPRANLKEVLAGSN